jgi:hypothetical protein
LIRGAEKLGLKFSSLAPVIRFADEKDLLGVADSSFGQFVSVVEGAVVKIPRVLPFVTQALQRNPSVYFTAAVISLSSACACVATIGEESAMAVALQTLLFVALGVLLPGAFVGCGILAKQCQGQ